jgi:hypothetical protein
LVKRVSIFVSELPDMRIVLLLVLVGLAVATPARAGYSQYWNWRKPPDAGKVRRCIQDMRKVIAGSPVPLAGAEGDGSPLITDSDLIFNQKGDEESTGEAFIFPGRAGRNSCKTNGLAYDRVVVACLMVVRDHFTPEEVSFDSDGGRTDAWADGIALYKRVFGKDPNISKDSKLSSFLDNIDLKPTWSSKQLWIAIGLLALGGGLLWYFFHPKPDFTIQLSSDGDAVVSGRFPQNHTAALRAFFKDDLPGIGHVMIKGWYDPDGRIRLDFAGSVSQREQQRVRNFIASLRLK